MKKIVSLLLFSFLISFCQAQDYIPGRDRQRVPSYGYDWRNGKFTGSLVLPNSLAALVPTDEGGFAYYQGHVYFFDGTNWVQADGISPNTFAMNNKFMRFKSGVIRPTATVTPNSPITWAFIDSAGSSAHRNFGFDSVRGNGDVIEIYYPYTKFVSSLVITPDEYLSSAGVLVGSSVSQNMAQVYAYRVGANAGKLTGNTTSWSALHLTTSVLSYNTSSGLTVFTPTTASGTILGASVEVEGCQISYVGTNNYHIRRQYSGLGSGIIGFYLVDNITNTPVTGNLSASDIVSINIPRPKMISIPAQTVASSGYPADLYTSGANYWIIACFELWFIAYPESATSNKMEWQSFKIGSNYATSYRITRATIAAPGTETTVFSGYGFSTVDNSATSGTQYIYRMYATVLGVESLVTNEHCVTK